MKMGNTGKTINSIISKMNSIKGNYSISLTKKGFFPYILFQKGTGTANDTILLTIRTRMDNDRVSFYFLLGDALRK